MPSKEPTNATNTPAPTHDTGQAIPDAKPIVHPEVYRFFNTNQLEGSDQTQIHTINQWACGEDGNISKALKKIQRLEITLGVPKVGETRVSKMYNYIRLNNQVDQLKSTKMIELAAIKEQVKQKYAQLKAGQKPKIDELDATLKELKNKYKSARKAYKLNATAKAQALEDAYANQIRELETLCNIYINREKE